MTTISGQSDPFLANHAAWFAATGEATLVREIDSGVSASVVAGHGHLTVSVRGSAPIHEVESGLKWLRTQSARSVLLWAERDNRDLDILLASRGFGDSFCPTWMVRDLSLPLVDVPFPESIRISRASADDLSDLAEAGEIPYLDVDSATKNLQSDKAGYIWMLIAREGDSGPIVGHLTLFVPPDGSGGAGVYGAGVRPDRQRRGIGSALTLAACRVANEAGATHLSLNATPDGERAYRKVGFEVLGEGRTWFMELAAGDSGPDRADVAWAERLARGNPGEDDLPRAGSTIMLNGESPLAFAARFDQVESAAWLIDHGAIREISAMAKLHLWSEVEVALRDPGLVNARIPPHGRTPLHVAVLEDDRTLATMLLSANADMTIRDGEFGGTALDWANHLHRTELASIIREATGG